MFISCFCLVAAACQSTDQTDLLAENTTTSATEDTTTSIATADSVVEAADQQAATEADFDIWYADVDKAVDDYQAALNADFAAGFDRLVEGERQFAVFGEFFVSTAAISRVALDTLPASLGDTELDPLYTAFVASVEQKAVGNEAGAEVYEGDPDAFEEAFNSPFEPGDIFAQRDDAAVEFERACLALSEAATALGQEPLDCFGLENTVEPEATGDDFVVLEVGDSVDLQIGEVALTYEATVTTERADWGDDWLAANDQPGYQRTWWLGMPEGLADPNGELALETVLEAVPFSLDLDPWLADFQAISVLSSGEDQIGGLEARYWDIYIDAAALEPFADPIIAVVKANAGNPVGGIQLAFDAGWRMWTIDHPAGPVLYIQTAFIDTSVTDSAFENMTEEQSEAGLWPDIDPQIYAAAIATLEGHSAGLTFNVD